MSFKEGKEEEAIGDWGWDVFVNTAGQGRSIAWLSKKREKRASSGYEIPANLLLSYF